MQDLRLTVDLPEPCEAFRPHSQSHCPCHGNAGSGPTGRRCGSRCPSQVLSWPCSPVSQRRPTDSATTGTEAGAAVPLTEGPVIQSTMLILISGPYMTGTDGDENKIAANLDRMEEMALPLFEKGHLAVVAEWLA